MNDNDIEQLAGLISSNAHKSVAATARCIVDAGWIRLDEGLTYTKLAVTQPLPCAQEALSVSDDYKRQADSAAAPTYGTTTGGREQNFDKANHYALLAIWRLLRHQVESSDSSPVGPPILTGTRVPAQHVMLLGSFLSNHWRVLKGDSVYFDVASGRSYLVHEEDGEKHVEYELQWQQ